MFGKQVPFNAATDLHEAIGSLAAFTQCHGVDASLIDLAKTLASQKGGLSALAAQGRPRFIQ